MVRTCGGISCVDIFARANFICVGFLFPAVFPSGIAGGQLILIALYRLRVFLPLGAFDLCGGIEFENCCVCVWHRCLIDRFG